MEKIQIHTLVTDGLQTRVMLNEEVVADYVEIIRNGGTLPPVAVFRDVLTDYLADGFHRLEAAKRLGHIDIEAEVHDGDRTAALRHALKANARHGLRRTNEDKRKALRIAWENRQTLFGHDPSKRELAAVCCVSDYLAWDFIKEQKVVENTTPSDSSSDKGHSAMVGGDPRAPRDECVPHEVISKPIGRADLCVGRNQITMQNRHLTMIADATERVPPIRAEGFEIVPHDRYGTPIPENLAGAFDARQIKKMSRVLRKMVADVESERKAGNYAFSRISQSTLITLRNAAADLKLDRPWCVCRQCQGVGCRACGEIGVQTKREYDRNPRELRDEG